MSLSAIPKGSEVFGSTYRYASLVGRSEVVIERNGKRETLKRVFKAGSSYEVWRRGWRERNRRKIQAQTGTEYWVVRVTTSDRGSRVATVIGSWAPKWNKKARVAIEREAVRLQADEILRRIGGE